MKNDLTLLPCALADLSEHFPNSYDLRRSFLGGALFDAGVKWSAICAGFSACTVVTVSFDARTEWQNGIVENSRYAKFIVHDYKGSIVLERLSGFNTTKLRARKLKSFEHLVEVLVKWARENAA
jgi:hypothetical protein